VQIVRSSVERTRFFLLFVGALAGFSIGAVDAEAQGTTTFQVTNLLDSGPGSLREAITDANASNAGTKFITFAVVDNGIINLASDLPEIVVDGVTINGATAVNLSVVAGGLTTRIFDLGIDTNTTTVRDIGLDGAPLQIGSGASLSLDVSADQQFDDVITDAEIGDAGHLIKEGDATLTLRGANDYSGGTLVRAGTLRGDTTSLQGDIAVDSGGVVAFDQSNDDVYTDAITGQGAVQKTGTGEVEFTGGNTYAGGTTISAGSLRGDVGSLQGNIAVESGGAVIFDQGTAATYAGNLTGAGGFTKEGAGTLTLSGTNTISGPSSLDGGALYGSFASIPRNLTTAGGTSVTFDHDTDGTYSGSLKGVGAFNKLGTGTLTLSGTNTISGQADLAAGALRGGFAGIPVKLSTAAGTSVTFNHTNNGTYAGIITGLADVTKAGNGTLTLSGANTFTGLTSITGGRLFVNDSLAGGVDVGANTVLGGTGSIGGPVTVSGTVAPGNSIGELTVGSIVFAPGSVFEVEVNDLGAGAGESDRLIVLGNADIAGASVLVSPGAGNYLVPVNVEILSTGVDLTTEFESFGPDFAFLDITPDYTDLRSVMLTIARNTAGLGQYAQTPNQSTIAAVLEAARIDPNAKYSEDIETVFQSLDVLTVNQVPGALDAMTGETLTQFATSRLATAQRFGRSLDARIREYQWDTKGAIITAGSGEARHLSADSAGAASSPILGVAMLGVGPMGAPRVGTTAIKDPLLRIWIDGSGIYGDVDGNSNESAFDYTIWGGSLGADVQLAEHWVLGLAGGYANTDIDFSSRPGEGDLDTYQGALYAGYVDPRFHVGVSGRYAYNDMDGKRDIAYGLNRTAKADLDGNDFGARFESGLNLVDIGGFVLQPTAAVDYNRLDQDGYTESGAGSLNLAVEDNDLDSLVLGVGMRVHGTWKVDDNLWIVPELHGRWLHEFLDTDRLIEARLVSGPVGGSAFQIQGVELPRDSGSVGVAWNVITQSAWSIIGSYDAILNEDLVQHVGSITLSFEW
jgi:autotransporter-associated beta strand protein